jgi:hypothetical protein
VSIVLHRVLIVDIHPILRPCFLTHVLSVDDNTRCVRTSGLKPQVVNTYEDGFKLVLSGGCDYFYSVGANILRNTNGKYCGRLSTVGAPFYDSSLSYLLPKNSSLTTPISLATLSLRDTNSLVSVQEFNSKQLCRSQVSAAVVSIREFRELDILGNWPVSRRTLILMSSSL